jgi:hypothetical protein
MKNIYFQTIAIFLIALLTASCEDYLDKEKEEILDETTVFSNEAYTFNFLVNVYSSLPINYALENDYTSNPFVGGCDEMEITYLGAFSQQLNSGAWGPTSLRTVWEKTTIWGLPYEGIRKANIFLANIDKVPMDTTKRNRWKGEALWLRAMLHFLIVRCHGPIPIVDKVFVPGEDYTKIERQPIDAVFRFIADECSKAAELLEPYVTESELGRATKISASALRSRALLYLASPLWNGNEDYAGFVSNGKQLVPSVTETEKKVRWKDAYEAAKLCIDIAEENGYKLYHDKTDDPVENYRGIFLNNHNEEILFARNVGSETQFEGCSNPLSEGGFSIYCPTQEMVDAYETANGLTPITGYYSSTTPVINAASGYTEDGFAPAAHPLGYHPAGISNMYTNREPRFYASINYNGAIWKNHAIQFYYEGIDGRKGAGYDYCITGYLLRKMVDPNSDIRKWVSRNKAYIYFRLAEIYLNYAEALNECDGPVSDVYEYVNRIRNRAGLPDLPDNLSQSEMRDKIKHERRIELAFEQHRYFDIRRWNEASLTENREITGMNILAGTGFSDPNYYKRTVVERRLFEYPKHNLWPVPQSEIDKYPNLVQNPKW